MKYLIAIFLLFTSCQPKANDTLSQIFTYDKLSKTPFKVLTLTNLPDTTFIWETGSGISIKGKYHLLNTLYPGQPENIYLSDRYVFGFKDINYRLFYITYQPPNSSISPTRSHSPIYNIQLPTSVSMTLITTVRWISRM